MKDELPIIYYFFLQFKQMLLSDLSAVVCFLPIFLIFDVPLNLLVLSGIGRWVWRNKSAPKKTHYAPLIVTVHQPRLD